MEQQYLNQQSLRVKKFVHLKLWRLLLRWVIVQAG